MADLIISQPMTFTVDVKTGLVERPQRESLMRGDKYANRIIVELVDGSEPFDITGVTVKGEFCKPPNGDSINLSGEAKGNVAEVQLTDQCYTTGGHYEARVILVLDEVERTVLFISGDVLKSGSGNAAGDEPGGTGSGLPAGGTAGQVLVKVSSAQGDAIWKKLTAADVGALPSDGTAVNANALNGKSAEYYATAESVSQLSQQTVNYRKAVNLLDNSDFRNPVNQRGDNVYTAAEYSIDRWYLWSANGAANATIESGRIAINLQTDSIATLSQRFAKGTLNAPQYTFAYMTDDGNVHIKNNPIQRENDGFDFVSINATKWTGVVWAALYEGNYTAETLPPYVPKGYVAELQACLRYAWIPSNDMIFRAGATSSGYAVNIIYPMTMAHAPSINFEPVDGTSMADGTVLNGTPNGISIWNPQFFNVGKFKATCDL